MYKEKNGFKTILSLLLFVTLILAMSSASAADDGGIDDAVMTDEIDNGVDELSFSSDDLVQDTDSSCTYSVDDATVTEDDEAISNLESETIGSDETNEAPLVSSTGSDDDLATGTQDISIDLEQDKLYGGDVCNFTIKFNETDAGGSVKVTIVDTTVPEDTTRRTFVYSIPVVGGIATASSATSISIDGTDKTFDEVLLWPYYRTEWDDGVQRFPDSVTIAYSGDDTYAPKTVEKSLTVYPYEAEMEIDITKGQGEFNDIDYGESLGLVKFEVLDPFQFDNPYYEGNFLVVIVDGDLDVDDFNPIEDADEIIKSVQVYVNDGDGSYDFEDVFDEGYYLIGIFFDEVNFPRYVSWEGFNIVKEPQEGPFVVLSSGLGYPTLEDAIEAAVEGDNITVIEEGVYKGIKNTGLLIEKSLNIAALEGLNVVFDCESLNNFITVTADKVVVLKDISIINGKAEKGGAVNVLSGGRLATEHVNFTDNIATLSGGAIYAEDGSYLVLMESVFASNKALDPYESKGGGALYIGEGFAVLTNSNFTANEALSSAGAIYIGADKFMIHNCAFNGNKALEGPGGAIWADGEDGRIEESTFDSNEAISYGGAIFLQGNNCTVKETNFTSNKAGENSPGNAIFWAGNQGAIENSTFDSNVGGPSAILWLGNEGSIKGSCFKNNGNDPEVFNIFDVAGVNLEENTFEVSNLSIKADSDLYASGDDAVINGYFNWGVNSHPIDLKVDARRDQTDIGFVIENYNGGNFSYELNELLSGYYTLAIVDFIEDTKNNRFIIKTDARDDFSVLGNVLVPTDIVITVSDIKYGEDENAVVNLKASDGTLLNGVVKLSIGDEVQNITVENGAGEAKFTNLSANKYVAIAQFDGDDTYASSFATAPIVVSQLKTRILCKNMTTTAINVTEDGRIGEYFTWKLVDENGRALADKAVSIGFNANVYNRVTNASGEARLQINLQNSGPYTFAIAFLGDENYEGAFEVLKITVNKQKASLSASSKTYKASAKTKTLAASYKTKAGKAIVGKTVKFTVSGKTYSAKTDSKGTAKVNVSLTKAGSYTVEVKAPATNTYAEVSKKITLKLT